MDVFTLEETNPTDKAEENDKSALIWQREGKPGRCKMVVGAVIGVGLVMVGVIILITSPGSSKHDDASPSTYGANEERIPGQIVKPGFRRPSTSYNTPGHYSYNFNEGRLFALSFPRIHLEQNDSTYSILVIAREPTFVNISVPHLKIDKSVFVGPDVLTHEEVLDVAITTHGGVEDKAVYISSTRNVTVECSTMQFAVRDAFLALPVNEADLEYYISTCSGTGCEFMAVSFVSVVATEDNTTLDITCPPGVTGCTSDINLDHNQTYTLYTQDDTELTGLHVKASKPVSVFSGNPCFGLADGADQGDNQVAVASIPPVRQLGTQYLTPLISSDPSKRHRLRVVSSSSNTTLLIPSHGIDVVLNEGEFYNLDYYGAVNTSVVLHCSRPCVVVHCNKQHTGYTRQVFMMPLIPEEAYTSNVFFSTIDSTAEGNFLYHYLSIIANQYPVDSLYLDDVTLAAENWTNAETANTSAVMIAISPGLHELKSNNPSVRFAAYIHGNGAPTTDFPGYGLETGRGDPLAPPPTVPPTEGPDTRVQPVYQINLYGNFTSRSGEDFDLQCTLDYSDELGDKATSMIPVVNSLLGTSLCDTHNPDDFRVVSVTHYLSTNGPDGITRVDYFIQLDRELQISEVHQCADEVKVYLMDHVNWGIPLLPALPGCPFPEFDPPRFYDDGSQWICVSSYSGNYPQTPGYQVELRSEFITMTGEDLSVQCGIDYKQKLDQRVGEMFVELNNDLLGKVICDNLVVTALTGTGALVHVGAEGVVDVHYVLQSADTHAFEEMYDCADDVILYLMDHQNWGIPLLSQVPGCPRLWFYQQMFEDKGQSWVCLS